MRRPLTTPGVAPTRGGRLPNPLGNRSLPARPGAGGAAPLALPAGKGAVPPMGNGRIAASIKLLDNALEKGVRARDVAPTVGLSRSRFVHLFKAQTGLTFRQYVRAARLARAKLLLRDMRLRVEEVAWRCGYAHTSNLDREFEREFGLSPSDYRRSASG